MGKYGEALGIWEVTIGGADLKLRPKKGDNLRLMKILRKNKGDEEKFFIEIYDFLMDLIKRDVPPMGTDEEEELKEYVEFNLMELFKDMMVKFRWATAEQIKSLESDASKKEN